MYRAPIRGGRDAIGAAIGAGVAGAAAGVAGGLEEKRRQEEEERRRAEEQRRYQEAQRLAQEARELALLQAGGRYVDESEAYDPITASVNIPQPEAEPGAPQLAVPARQVTLAGRGARREGVEQVGDRFVEFDPRRSLDYRTRRAALEDATTQEQAEVARKAAAIRAADPTVSEEDAIATAMGIDPLSFEEQLGRQRQELELRDEFGARSDARRRSTSRSELTASQNLRRQETAAEGFALTAAEEARQLAAEIKAGTRRAGPGWTPLAHIRSNLRVQAAEAGLNLSEGEIQRLAVRALHGIQDQDVQTRRLQQQEALAEHGQRALEAIDRGVPIAEAARLLASQAGISPADAMKWLTTEEDF